MSGGENVGMPMGKPPMYKTVDEIEEKIEKYQIQLDGKTFPLAAYLQEKDFYLPIIGESGSHSIRIFDLASGKNACVYDYFVIPEFTYSLNYPIFFDEGKTVTVQTFDAHYGHREFTIYSEPGNNTIQIPGFTAMATLQLSLPVVHATLLQSDQHRNLFTLENKDLDVAVHYDVSVGYGLIKGVVIVAVLVVYGDYELGALGAYFALDVHVAVLCERDFGKYDFHVLHLLLI